MSAEQQVPFIEGYFEWPSTDPRLIGSRCVDCDLAFFPRGFRCPNPACFSDEVEDLRFPRSGILASFTVVRYPPPPPFVPTDPFEAFAIAEVAFDNGVQVIGPVPVDVGLDLTVGSPMETEIDAYYTNDAGTEVVGWKFRPVEESP